MLLPIKPEQQPDVGKKEEMMYKYLLILISLFVLVGCEETYRYPCQDPKNRGIEECKPENCSITRTCILDKDKK